MIMDSNAVFSDAQSFTSTAASTNVIDCQVADANLGSGTPIWLVCRVNTAFNGSGAITATLQTCATSGGTYLTVVSGRSLSTADSTAGDDVLTIPLPPDHLRFLRVYYTVTHNSAAAGAVDAYLAANAPSNFLGW